VVDLSALPNDIETLKAAWLEQHARAQSADAAYARIAAELANEQARRADDAALIVHMKLQIEKLKRDKYGPKSERASRLLDQMAFELEELEGAATEDELAAERAAANTTNVSPFTRKRPSRKPFPDHLPRERVIVPGPTACTCCGGARLAKLGEDMTETLETVPRTWKVIQHVPCWCSRNSASTSRSTARLNAMPEKVCHSASPHSPTRWGRAARCWTRSLSC